MSFQTPGEKIKAFRKLLNIRQEDLKDIGVSRNLISMIETNRRRLNSDSGKILYRIFLEKAEKLNLKLDIDSEYLSLTPKKAAEKYCSESLIKGSLEDFEIDEILELSIRYDLLDIQVDTYILRASILYKDENYKKALLDYYNALDICNRIVSDTKKYYIYNEIGKCKFMLKAYEEALSYFEKSYLHSLENNENQFINALIYDMALTHKNLRNVDKAIVYIDEYIEAIDKNEDLDSYIDAVIIKADCYVGKKEYEQAISLYTETVSLFDDSIHAKLGEIYNNLGVIYLETNSLDKALKYFNKAIIIRRIVNNSKLPYSLLEKSKVLVEINVIEQAIVSANEAIELAVKNDNTKLAIDAYYHLVNIYKHLNNRDKIQSLYLEILKLLKEGNRVEDILRVYIELALLNNEDNSSKAKEFLEKALKI